jgi:TPR repeat protein
MGTNVRKLEGTYRYLASGFLTLLISASLAVAAHPGQFEDATAAYERGDYPTAFRLMKPLAEQGDAYAQYNLALFYSNGQGVPQDYAEAAKWYRKAAEQGDDDAQYNLALFYSNGQGVPQDYAEAAKWCRRAAEQGNTMAQLNLGFMYGTGQGVPQDYVMAHMWYNLAASRLSPLEKEARENALKNKDIAASVMTAEQIAEAQRLAREWRPKKEAR